MDFIDPFKVDSSRYKDLLDSDSPPKYDKFVEVTESGDIFDKNTINGLPDPRAFAALKAANDRLKQNDEEREKVANMFNNLFSELNNKYGLGIKFDFNSFSNSIQYIIEPVKKRAMEYYLSEAYGRFRVILYQQYLQAIALLSSQILNPQYILSDSMTYADKLDIMKQLYEFMRTMNDIYKEVNVPDTDLKLEKLSEDSNSVQTDIDDPKVRDFMTQLFGNIKDKK